MPFSPDETEQIRSSIPINDKTLARLALLNAHLSPASLPMPDIGCEQAACLARLDGLLHDQPSDSEIRCCAHDGCGFVSRTKDEWERHILTDHHSTSSTDEASALTVEGLTWESWGEGGLCCA